MTFITIQKCIYKMKIKMCAVTKAAKALKLVSATKKKFNTISIDTEGMEEV